MQHVRIRQDHVGPLANRLARVLRRIAVVGESPDLRAHFFHRGIEFVKLIFGQRLGGKQVHRARSGIAQQQVQHRQVVAPGLAARGRRHDGDVVAGGYLLERVGLVGVQSRDAARLQRLSKTGIYPTRHLGERAFRRRLVMDGAYR